MPLFNDFFTLRFMASFVRDLKKIQALITVRGMDGGTNSRHSVIGNLTRLIMYFDFNYPQQSIP